MQTTSTRSGTPFRLAVIAASLFATAQLHAAGTYSFTHGVNDIFSAAGVETTSQGAGLSGNLAVNGHTNLTDFDSTLINHFVADTIFLPNVGSGEYISAATITFALKPNGSSLNSNDAVNIGIFNSNGTYTPGNLWNSYIGSGEPTTGLLGSLWNTTNYPSGHTFALDLGNMPAGNVIPTGNSLLEVMSTSGHLDFVVQDDTSVDYVTVNYTVSAVPETSPTLWVLALGVISLTIRRRHNNVQNVSLATFEA